jgi:DNA-binding MarR family transcriptional regulator
MTIENAIKQKKFKSPFQRLLVNLIFTSNVNINHLLRLLKPYGLTIQQYNVLRILKGQHPKKAKINDIIDRMLDKMSNASRLVDKLVEKKLVTRNECCADRRAVDVTITQAGLDMLTQLEEIETSMERIMMNLTEQEAEELSNLLDKLRG